MTDVDGLRTEIAELHRRRLAGELGERRFEQTLGEKTNALCRAVLAPHLAPGEPVLAEHHVVHAHLKLSESVLREPEQRALSLYATDRRLFALRLTLAAGRPVTCDERDETRIDRLDYTAGVRLRRRRQVRSGETLAGLVIACVGVLAGPWLQVTGTMLVVLGALGVLHGVALPTRWLEIEDLGRPADERILIHAPRKRSARKLVAVLRARTAW